MKKYTDGYTTVTAKNYTDAAVKLYGQIYYKNPACKGTVPTTCTHVYRGYADVEVYNIGDKQGTYWGCAAARPQRYILRRA